MAKADPGVVVTACAYRSAFFVSTSAAVPHREVEAADFGTLAEQMRSAFNAHFVDQGRVQNDCPTEYSLVIKSGLLERDGENTAGARLVEIS